MKMNQYLHHNSFHAALTSPLKENECKQTAYSCCDPHIRLSGVLVHGVSSKYKHYDFVSQASILKKFCRQSVFLFFSFFLCFFFLIYIENITRKCQVSGVSSLNQRVVALCQTHYFAAVFNNHTGRKIYHATQPRDLAAF